MGTSVALLLFLVVSETAFSLSNGQNVADLAEAIGYMGIKIHRILAEDDVNFCLSPLSIAVTLEMLLRGTGGKTADQMRNALGYEKVGLTDNCKTDAAYKSLAQIIGKNSESEEYVIHILFSVLTQKNYPIAPEYMNALRQRYNVTSGDVDFQKGVKRPKGIKDCVKFKANNQLDKVQDDFDKFTTMVLLNAGCFKGAWKKTEFNVEKSKSKMVFYNKGLHELKTRVQMINIVGKLRVARVGEGIVLEIPYKGDDLVFLLYRPDAMDGAYEAEQKLHPHDGVEALSRARKRWLMVSVPILNLECETSLNSALQRLGIKVFENSANMTGISKAGNPSVLEVFQKGYLKLDDEGTEASGGAEVVIGIKMEDGWDTIAHEADPEADGKPPKDTGMLTEPSMGIRIERIFVDRPFLFALCDSKKRFVYLQGRVCEL